MSAKISYYFENLGKDIVFFEKEKGLLFCNKTLELAASIEEKAKLPILTSGERAVILWGLLINQDLIFADEESYCKIFGSKKIFTNNSTSNLNPPKKQSSTLFSSPTIIKSHTQTPLSKGNESGKEIFTDNSSSNLNPPKKQSSTLFSSPTIMKRHTEILLPKDNKKGFYFEYLIDPFLLFIHNSENDLICVNVEEKEALIKTIQTSKLSIANKDQVIDYLTKNKNYLTAEPTLFTEVFGQKIECPPDLIMALAKLNDLIDVNNFDSLTTK